MNSDAKPPMSPLLQVMEKQVADRTVLAHGHVKDILEIKFADLPVTAKLLGGAAVLFKADSTSRILFAPPSTSKTSACQAFIKVRGDDQVNVPALLFTGDTIIPNYFECMVSCYPGYDDGGIVFECLMAALR